MAAAALVAPTAQHAKALAALVVDNERAVSFSWLARELGVSADAAKT